jgi:hypothetical protein
MAYIGKEPIVGNFQKCDAITVVNGQAAYTLQVSSVNVSPESANHMLVSLNGILQAPTTSFTVSGSTLTFASNLATGDVIDFVMLLGNVLDLGVPSDDTVGAAQIKDDLISGTTALASEPASTDEFLVSDAGTLKRLDFGLITNTPNWKIGMSAAQSLAYNTVTKIDFDTSIIDSDSGVDTTNNRYTIPTGKGGTYIVHCFYRTGTGTDSGSFDILVYKNGSLLSNAEDMGSYIANLSYNTVQCTGMLVLSAGDYIEMYASQTHVNASHNIGYSSEAGFWGYRLIGA